MTRVPGKSTMYKSVEKIFLFSRKIVWKIYIVVILVNQTRKLMQAKKVIGALI